MNLANLLGRLFLPLAVRSRGRDPDPDLTSAPSCRVAWVKVEETSSWVWS